MRKGALASSRHHDPRAKYATFLGARQLLTRPSMSLRTVLETELADVQARIYDLSFDPYHATEMRWGAYPRARAELDCSRFRPPSPNGQMTLL